MDIEKLRLLETRIEDVLTRHTAVCEERSRLRQELERASGRLRETQAELKRYTSERDEIRHRVERILGRLTALHIG